LWVLIFPSKSRTSSDQPALTGGLPAAAAVPLFTPKEIDDLTLRRDLVECDCSRVTTGTDLTTDWTVVRAEAPAAFNEALAEISDLTSLDALGALKQERERASSASANVTRRVSDECPITADGTISGASYNANLHQMRLSVCYLREFLSRAHPLLGRAGPTCPFVPKALKLDCMRLGLIPTGTSPSASSMRELVRGFIPIFEALEPQKGPTAVFKAVLLLFPQIPLERAAELIDGTQAALKEEFVSRGLMLGEFHLLNNAAGLHNPGFFPLRTVSPALAIRHMVPSDLVFMTGDHYPPARRAAFLQSYIGKMAGEKGKKAQDDMTHAQQLLDALQSEL